MSSSFVAHYSFRDSDRARSERWCRRDMIIEASEIYHELWQSRLHLDWIIYSSALAIQVNPNLQFEWHILQFNQHIESFRNCEKLQCTHENEDKFTVKLSVCELVGRVWEWQFSSSKLELYIHDRVKRGVNVKEWKENVIIQWKIYRTEIVCVLSMATCEKRNLVNFHLFTLPTQHQPFSMRTQMKSCKSHIIPRLKWLPWNNPFNF